MKVGPYRGYTGTAEPSEDNGNLRWHGRVDGIKDVVTFQGTNADITQEFQDSVDDYLEFCETLNESSDTPTPA